MISLESIRTAAGRIAGAVERTPFLPSQTLSRLTGCELYLKFENLQFTASFKERGALNKLLALSDAERRRGVIAMSAGNHAQAVAYHAARLGIPAQIVMPKGSPNTKIRNTRVHGATVLLEGETLADAARHAQGLAARDGLAFVHPYEDELIISGQGTVGLEMLEALPALDVLAIPVGGGGLIAGVSAAVKRLQPEALVFGVEPEGAPSMYRSFASGKPEAIDKVRTIADSLGAPYALPQSFALARANVDEIVLIDDDAMRRAMAVIFREMKLAVEPAGAAATAALAGPLRERLRGKRVGLVVCGSNIDIATFAKHVGDGEAAA
jgi:threonine dehydratase